MTEDGMALLEAIQMAHDGNFLRALAPPAVVSAVVWKGPPPVRPCERLDQRLVQPRLRRCPRRDDHLPAPTRGGITSRLQRECQRCIPIHLER